MKRLTRKNPTMKALLDEAGYVDVDGDGMREMPDGSKIEWKAECPMGWSDWNASLEILCESAKAIGLNIGGKIGIARSGDHIVVAVFFGIGLLHLNEVAIALGHRVV